MLIQPKDLQYITDSKREEFDVIITKVVFNYCVFVIRCI